MSAVMLLLLAGLSIAQAAEPTGTLMLACKGTETGKRYGERFSEQVAFGIILDFEKKTVAGFPDVPVDVSIKIFNVHDTAVDFAGSSRSLEGSSSFSMHGNIERVTGTLFATERLSTKTERKAVLVRYELNCKPTQRMF